MKNKRVQKSFEDEKGIFKTNIPLSIEDGKVKIIEKTIGDRKVKYLTGEATNNLVDKADERVAKSFMDKMKKSMKGINVFIEHDHHLDNTVGYVDSVDGTNSNVIVTTALENENKNKIVKSILDKMEHGTKMFYSIWGKITKASKTFDENLQKNVRELIDGEIYEVSITALPEGDVGFLEPISKALDDLINEDEEDLDDFEEGISEEIAKALAHNSKLKDNEPAWGNVDKTKLPRNAYADMGYPGKKSTWKYPHHWVVGGKVGNDGVYTSGDMYLHKGGLIAAWAAAQGARSGKKASPSVIAHLQKHRKAIGITSKTLDSLVEKYMENFDVVEELSKTLQEMIQSNNIDNQIYDLLWTFKSAIHRITTDGQLTPAEKKDKIINLSGEYASQIEELSIQLADLVNIIESEFQSSTNK